MRDLVLSSECMLGRETELMEDDICVFQVYRWSYECTVPHLSGTDG